MRFVESDEAVPAGAHVLNEVMIPVCSPSYLKAAKRDASTRAGGNTVIQLTDSPTDWAARYAPFKTGRAGPDKTLTFSDYAVVIQAALLSQGIAFGWLTVVSHALTTGALLPAASTLTRTSRRCVLLGSSRRALRPIVAEIRAWIITELQREIQAIDEAHPSLGVRAACL
jgi:DNA-binding transcriptional LysR family regulator